MSLASAQEGLWVAAARPQASCSEYMAQCPPAPPRLWHSAEKPWCWSLCQWTVWIPTQMQTELTCWAGGEVGGPGTKSTNSGVQSKLSQDRKEAGLSLADSTSPALVPGCRNLADVLCRCRTDTEPLAKRSTVFMVPPPGSRPDKQSMIQHTGIIKPLRPSQSLVLCASHAEAERAGTREAFMSESCQAGGPI